MDFANASPMSDNSTLDESLNSSGEHRDGRYDVITSNGSTSLVSSSHQRLRARLERGKQELAQLLARDVDNDDRLAREDGGSLGDAERELMRMRARAGLWPNRQGAIRMDEDEVDVARIRSSERGVLDELAHSTRSSLQARDREQVWRRRMEELEAAEEAKERELRRMGLGGGRLSGGSGRGEEEDSGSVRMMSNASTAQEERDEVGRVQQLVADNLELKRRLAKLSEANSTLLQELQHAEQSNAQLVREVREVQLREVKDGNEREEMEREVETALKMRDDAMEMFETAMAKLSAGEKRRVDSMAEAEHKVLTLERQLQVAARQMALGEEEREVLQRRAAKAEELALKERESKAVLVGGLEEELGLLKRELLKTQTEWQEDIKAQQAQQQNLQTEAGALEAERKARLSLQMYLESITVSLIREAGAAREEFVSVSEELDVTATEVMEEMNALAGDRAQMRAELQRQSQQVESKVKEMMEQCTVMAQEAQAARAQVQEVEARSRQQVSTLAKRNQLLTETSDLATSRAGMFKSQLEMRDMVLQRTLERLERMAAVQAEQGGVGQEWEAEAKQLRAQMRMVKDGSQPPRRAGEEAGEGNPKQQLEQPVLVQDGEGPMINTAALQGRKRRRDPASEVEEEPEKKSSVDDKATPRGSWLGKLLFGASKA